MLDHFLFSDHVLYKRLYNNIYVISLLIQPIQGHNRYTDSTKNQHQHSKMPSIRNNNVANRRPNLRPEVKNTLNLLYINQLNEFPMKHQLEHLVQVTGESETAIRNHFTNARRSTLRSQEINSLRTDPIRSFPKLIRAYKANKQCPPISPSLFRRLRYQMKNNGVKISYEQALSLAGAEKSKYDAIESCYFHVYHFLRLKINC